MKKMSILAASSALLFAACSGDETTNITEVTESTGMDIIAKGEKMPACDKENAGKMIFVTDSSAVYYCANKNWSSLNGKDGVDGVKGADGESVKGEDGTSCTAREVDEGIEISCGDKVVGTIKNGAKGEDGKSIKGEDGTSCTAKEVDDGIEVSCGDKVVGTVKNGAKGEDGKSIKGEDGTSCSAREVDEGIEVSCGDKVVGTVKNGADGKSIKGEDGTSCMAKEVDEGIEVSCGDEVIGTIKNGEDGKDFVAEYDTVTTEFLNQEMLEAGDYGILVDKRDNKVYRTVKIGQQEWMAQNLNYSDGGVTSLCNGNDEENCKKYGRLYTWAAAMNLPDVYNDTNATTLEKGLDSILVRPASGLCPEGWHIPDTMEVVELRTFVKAKNIADGVVEDAGSSLKTATFPVKENTAKGSNRYGFSAAPGGSFGRNGSFDSFLAFRIWTASEYRDEGIKTPWLAARMYLIAYDIEDLRYSGYTNKRNAASVRCLKN